MLDAVGVHPRRERLVHRSRVGLDVARRGHLVRIELAITFPGADELAGFRLAGDFRTRYWTQGLYTWGDPMLDTHWETGITGYKVFVREAAGAEDSR